MTKRLSKARRAKALNRALVIDRAKSNDDSHMLQQGAVRCALSRPSANLKGMHVPKGVSLDSESRWGKVVRGAFKPSLKPVEVKRVTVPTFEDRVRFDVGVSDPNSHRAPKSKD